MKTAISLPEDTFDQATARARAMGISRSEFFVRAAKRYMADLDELSLTALIDEALDAAGSDDTAPVAPAAGRRRLRQQDDW